jgi:hypothetical protein
VQLGRKIVCNVLNVFFGVGYRRCRRFRRFFAGFAQSDYAPCAFVSFDGNPDTPQDLGQSSQAMAERMRVLGPAFGLALFFGCQRVESLEQLLRFALPFTLFLKQLTDRYANRMSFDGSYGALIEILPVGSDECSARKTNSGFVRRGGEISSDLPLMIAAIRSLKSSTVSTGRCSFTASLKLFAKPSAVANSLACLPHHLPIRRKD